MIEIRSEVIAEMIEHARQDAPLECCGLLLGVPGSPGQIEGSVRTRNVRESVRTYLIDPAEHLAVMKRARAEGRAVLGAYHSHPRSPAVPSPTDLAEAHYEEFLYIIVSLAHQAAPDVRGYRLSGRNFVPVTLVRVEHQR